MKKGSSIVYINFPPYDNAGRILDYLIDNFNIVVHFSYDHLRLKKGRRSRLSVYENGKLVFQKNLVWLRTHPILLFPSLPFVAFFIFTQSLRYILKLKKKYKKFDVYLTVNAFTAWCGNIYRSLGLVEKTIFWVWDYFPADYPDLRLRIARWVYWKFDKPALNSSTKVVFLNSQLRIVRKKHDKRLLRKNSLIIPIGTNPTDILPKKKNLIIGHMGMLKMGQGLDVLLDNVEYLINIFPKLKIEIIGSGPEENYFKKKAKKFKDTVRFYGFIEKDDDVDKIMKRWSIGIATYMPTKWSEHYWTDPSKIKAYLNQGVPVIATNVPKFAEEVKFSKAGIVVDYYKNQEFIDAVKSIIKNRKSFSENALKLAKKYDYRKLYPKIFD